jgi:hypothetical protein
VAQSSEIDLRITKNENLTSMEKPSGEQELGAVSGLYPVA